MRSLSTFLAITTTLWLPLLIQLGLVYGTGANLSVTNLMFTGVAVGIFCFFIPPEKLLPFEYTEGNFLLVMAGPVHTYAFIGYLIAAIVLFTTKTVGVTL